MDLSALQFGQAFNLLRKTTPMLLVRLGAMLLFWVVALVYFLIVGAVAFLVGQAIEFLGVIIFLVAIGGVGVLYQLAYKYVFYMIKAAHIAVISELLVNGKLPDGVNQLEWGRKQVTERFGEMSGMFVVDELIIGVIRVFTGTVYNIARWLPGDTMQGLAQVFNRVVHMSMSNIDEAILARSFYEERQGVWENARDGLVLYAMVWKPILINAVALMLISYIPAILAFIVFAAPIGFIVSIFSTQAAGYAIILLLLFSWLVKVAVGDAFTMTAIIAAYYRETRGMEPSPEMTARLEGISDKFREIEHNIKTEFGGDARKQKPKNDVNDMYDTSLMDDGNPV